MSSESSAGNAVITVSVGQGLIATINEYAVLLSLFLTLVGLIIGFYFHVIAVRDRRRFNSAKEKATLKQVALLEKKLEEISGVKVIS